MNQTSLNRRDFLKVIGTAGASLVIGIYLGGCENEGDIEIQEGPSTSQATAYADTPPESYFTPNIYLSINHTDKLTVTAFRSEMGQGIRTALAMLIADELDMPWENVVIEQAPADPAYGDQVTGGSASIATNNLKVRLAGASARWMLIQAAAQQWVVDPAGCTTQAGFVIHPDGDQELSYGELAGAASEIDPPDLGEALIKSKEDFNLIGKGIHHWDAPDIITGKALYGFDIKFPGMSYAVIARSPVFGGKLVNYDASNAELIPGVLKTYGLSQKVVVVAENTWAAIKGREALEITWENGENVDLNSASIQKSLAEKAPQQGSAAEGEIEAIYEMPYEAHMTMEPMNCTAHVHDGICEVWVPTQNPQSVKRAVQSALKMGNDAVFVNVTLMGGGFGRRLQADYAAEAAEFSKEIGGPVQVVWTREDDVQHDFYHPTSYHYASADPNNPKRRNIRSFSGDPFIPTGAWRSVGEFTAGIRANVLSMRWRMPLAEIRSMSGEKSILVERWM